MTSTPNWINEMAPNSLSREPKKKARETLSLALTLKYRPPTLHTQSHTSLSFSLPTAMASSQTRTLRRRRTQASKPISQSPLKSLSKSQIDDYYSDAVCEECGSGDAADELLLCDKCDRGFHLFCLRPIIVSVPKGPWFCPSCSSQKKLKCMLMVAWHYSIFYWLVGFLFNVCLSCFLVWFCW